jgi:hypothetical protein
MADYTELSIRELQAECTRRELPSGRARQELIERLEADDDGTGEEVVETAPEPVEEPVEVQAPPCVTDYQYWTVEGAFHVAFMYDGALTPESHDGFTEIVQYLAKTQSLRIIGAPELVLNQGNQVQYRAHVR